MVTAIPADAKGLEFELRADELHDFGQHAEADVEGASDKARFAFHVMGEFDAGRFLAFAEGPHHRKIP